MNASWQRANSPSISANVSAPEPALVAVWDDLAARLDTNVFMHPAALLAAAETGFATIHVLLAWDEATTPRRPVGFWALRERRDQLLLPAYLEALPYEYAFTSNAVIDPAFADDVVAALFDVIRRDARLPKIIRLRSFEADPVIYPAMLKHLADSGRCRELVRAERPVADRAFASRKSGSSRKKLRQLSGAGTVDIVNERTPASVEAAFEIFLRLEAASWKGKEGTALLCNAADARFGRRLIQNLAAHGLASVALLCVDGDAIAAQVLFYSGQRAYTWKTAFKASFARFSPGVLVADRAVRSLFESGRIATVDSCSTPGGFMGQLFTDRTPFVDALIDVRRRNPLVFALETARHRGYELLRRAQSRIRHIAASRRRAVPN